MKNIRYTFGIAYEGGRTCGTFVNDIGASHDEALRWIIKKKVADYGLRVVSAALWVDGKCVHEFRAKQPA